MTQDSRETLNRAAGILEGLSASEEISSGIADLLVSICEMLDEVLNKEKTP